MSAVAFGACGKPAPVAPTALSVIKPAPPEAVSGKIMAAKKKSEELKIKLKRDKNGDYAWEIDGGKVTDILKADKVLKRRLHTRLRTGAGQPAAE